MHTRWPLSYKQQQVQILSAGFESFGEVALTNVANTSDLGSTGLMATLAGIPDPGGSGRRQAGSPLQGLMFLQGSSAAGSRPPQVSEPQRTESIFQPPSPFPDPAGSGPPQASEPQRTKSTLQPLSPFPQPEHDNRMAITASDVIGTDAVKAAQQNFRHFVACQSRIPRNLREQEVQRMATKILKEWTLGLVVSRILSGQVPNERELIDMCSLMADAPEVLMLLWESRLREDVPFDTATTRWRKRPDAKVVSYFETCVILPAQTLVLRWFNELFCSILCYTIQHILPNARIFPDYADSWPIDSALKMKTLVLVSTGAYMHLYSRCNNSQSKIVNNQLSKVSQPAGLASLLVPFCCSIVTVAIGGVEEFRHEVSVAKILGHPGLMDLLYSKARYTRDFLNYIHSEGTESEKQDVEWLNTAVKAHVAMAIQPFHQSVVADLGSIVQPHQTAKLPPQFANLKSHFDFEKTYKMHDSDKSLPPVLVARLADARSEAKGRLELCQQMYQAMVSSPSLGARERRPSFFGGLGKRAFESLEGEGEAQTLPDTPGALTMAIPLPSRSKKGKHRATAALQAGPLLRLLSPAPLLPGESAMDSNND
ncbi:hypothetical protein H1R20_g5049, partial [Candolleomyces eurysporus]